jgi:hypothetical protein
MPDCSSVCRRRPQWTQHLAIIVLNRRELG